MDEFNIYGWSAIHEASYKGYVNSVIRFINYSREAHKNLLELKTIDELKATPLLVAALGGSLECIELLIESGSDINETIDYKQSKHGLIEIAIIRNDTNVLNYLFGKINNFGRIVRKLMISPENDDEIRASVGRCLETLTKPNLIIGDEIKIRNEIINHEDFGKCLALYTKFSLTNNEATLSAILILINVLDIDKIRDDFIKNNGIDLLITCLNIQRTKFTVEIEKMNDSELTEKVEKESSLAAIALGQVFAELTKYNDCLKYLNDHEHSGKIVHFFRLLFDIESQRNLYNKSNNEESVDEFKIDDFIGCYLITIGNLVYENEVNKNTFYDCSLYEILLNLWFNSNKLDTKQEKTKIIKLALVDCIGKLFYKNTVLKKQYIINKHEATHLFIVNVYENIDPNKSVLKEQRYASMTFLSRIAFNDLNIIRALVNFNDTFNAKLLLLIKDFIKRSPTKLKESAMSTLWILCGSEKYYESHDEKWIVYKVIGTRNLVDSLNDTDTITLVCLEALRAIAAGPFFRDHKTNSLINGCDDVGREHAVPALMHLMKTKNELIILNLLKTISSCCIVNGFSNHKKNQIGFMKLGILPRLIDYCNRKSLNERKLKYHAFYCLSCLCLNNSSNMNLVLKYFSNDTCSLIKTLLIMIMGSDTYTDENGKELRIRSGNFDEIKNRIIAGQCLCLFSYRNEEFQKNLISNFNRIPLKIFKDLIDTLNAEEKISNDPIGYAKAKCLLVTEIALLHKLIDLSKEKEDPRAFVINTLMELLKFSRIPFIRALAIDCFSRIIKYDKILVETLASVGLIEQLCYSIVNIRSSKLEICNAALALALLSDVSPEVRRRIIRYARSNRKVMDEMKYYNNKLNADLNLQWDHYENLMGMLKKEQPFKQRPSRKSIQLPKLTIKQNLSVKIPKLKI